MLTPSRQRFYTASCAAARLPAQPALLSSFCNHEAAVCVVSLVAQPTIASRVDGLAPWLPWQVIYLLLPISCQGKLAELMR